MTQVRKCYICGQPAHLCTCDDEDWEDDGETFEDDIDYDSDEFEQQFKK